MNRISKQAIIANLLDAKRPDLANAIARLEVERVIAAADPHDPKVIAAQIVKGLKKGGVGDVKVVETRGSSLRTGGFKGSKVAPPTRGWDGLAYIIMEVTPKGGEPYRLVVDLNWHEDGEHSGSASADAPRGTIPLHRAMDLQKWLVNAISDMVSWLGKAVSASAPAEAEPLDTQVFSAMKIVRKALDNFEGVAKKHSKAAQLAEVEKVIDQALQKAKKILQGEGGTPLRLAARTSRRG